MSEKRATQPPLIADQEDQVDKGKMRLLIIPQTTDPLGAKSNSIQVLSNLSN